MDAVLATDDAFAADEEDGFVAGGLAYLAGKGGTTGTMLIRAERLGGGDTFVAARLEEKATGLVRGLGGDAAACSDGSDGVIRTRRLSTPAVARVRTPRCAIGASVIAGDVCVARDADPFGVTLTDSAEDSLQHAEPEPAGSESDLEISGVAVRRGVVVGGVTRGGANIIGGIKLVDGGIAVGVMRGDEAAGFERVVGIV